jgi:hypothetical protein
MVKLAKLLTVVIVFALELPKAMPIALDPTQSKGTGVAIRTHQIS